MTPTTSTLKAGLEALLFATNHPLSLEAAAEALERSVGEVERALGELAEEYETGPRGIRLAELAGGWQMLTRPEFSSAVEKMLVGRRRARLSRAGLETLAAVAYHQPMTKGEVDTIRGVDCSGALRTLLDRELVAVKGRSDKVGRPLLYVTTDSFLEYFGLRSLDDLPQLEDFAALVDKEALLEEVESSVKGEPERAGATASEETSDESSGGDGLPPPEEVGMESSEADASAAQETAVESLEGAVARETGEGALESSEAEILSEGERAPAHANKEPAEAGDATDMELQIIEDDEADREREER